MQQNFAKNTFFKVSTKMLVDCSKNAENDYFNQRFDCTAPKRWSKYTYEITSFKGGIGD